MTRRDTLILRAAAVWTVFVWATFIRNVVVDGSQSFGFKAVHGLLAVVSIVFAVAIWRVATRSRHPANGRVRARS